MVKISSSGTTLISPMPRIGSAVVLIKMSFLLFLENGVKPKIFYDKNSYNVPVKNEIISQSKIRKTIAKQKFKR